ncbi:MAG TPA: DUF6526 family protein [Candidatus Eisenbacteria bacterium]|nr:DUF6526 family protein [Candidatus Eisenbacteria bacterium]
MPEQNYANHVRWVPLYHFFIVPVLVLNFGYAVARLFHAGYSFELLVGLLTALALLLFAFQARIFALTVQDRVIRLEERVRMEKLLPADLQPRIGDFSRAQLVGLRFASDAELPELARKVLSENVQQGKAIKQMVKSWRADFLRA